MFTAAGNTATYFAYRNLAPAAVLDGWGLFILLLLMWFGFLIVSGWLRPSPAPAQRLEFHRAVIEMWTWAGVLGVVWLLLPHGTVELQLVTLLFVACYAGTTVLSSADAPATLVPRILLVLGSLITVTITEQLPYWPAVAGFLALFALSLYALARLIQRNLASLADARANAEWALASRTQFLAAASHDLGQPLHSARLFLDQSVRSTDAQVRARSLERVGTALAAMERMLHSMLDHLRLDAGAIQPRVSVVEVNDVIATLVAQFEPVARLASIRLNAVPTRSVVAVDRQLFERAVGNLVDNALRHSGASRVLIGLRRRGDQARIWVIDDGRGIGGADPGQLFQIFEQGSAQPGPPSQGFGIGLASARRIMRLMGGSAGVQPDVRRGAAFFIDVPCVARTIEDV